MAFLESLLLFIVGGIIGFLVETAYCYLTTGKTEHRSGLVYEPFNPVYAFGAVLMTLLLKPLFSDNLLALFAGSAVFGALFEAVCSLFQEKTYGVVSWEYSEQRFSFFGGRTSLKFMFFWGLLGTVLSGIYGMNFVNMPALQHPYGYFIVLGVILGISGIVFLFLKNQSYYEWAYNHPQLTATVANSSYPSYSMYFNPHFSIS